MKRTFEKKENLSSFRLDLQNLTLFVNELIEQFKESSVLLRISIEIKEEKIEFSSIEEMKEYAENLPSLIKNFYISLSSRDNYEKGFLLSSNDGRAWVVVRSSDDIWGLIMLQICKKYVLEYKSWYSFIKPIQFILFGNAIIFIPLVLSIFYDIKPINIWIVSTWFLLIIVSFSMMFLFEKFFPSLVIEIRNEENLVKKYSTELTLLFTFLAFLVSLISLFL